MNRWAANNPELAEQGLTLADVAIERLDQAEREPCCVCGENLTRGGVTCLRCRDSLEEDRLRRELGQ